MVRKVKSEETAMYAKLDLASWHHGLLRSGDRMTQEKFHHLYEQTEPPFHAELVDGMVLFVSRLATSMASFMVAFEVASISFSFRPS